MTVNILNAKKETIQSILSFGSFNPDSIKEDVIDTVMREQLSNAAGFNFGQYFFKLTPAEIKKAIKDGKIASNYLEFANEFEIVNKRYNNVEIIDGNTGQTIKTSTNEN